MVLKYGVRYYVNYKFSVIFWESVKRAEDAWTEVAWAEDPRAKDPWAEVSIKVVLVHEGGSREGGGRSHIL